MQSALSSHATVISLQEVPAAGTQVAAPPSGGIGAQHRLAGVAQVALPQTTLFGVPTSLLRASPPPSPLPPSPASTLPPSRSPLPPSPPSAPDGPESLDDPLGASVAEASLFWPTAPEGVEVLHEVPKAVSPDEANAPVSATHVQFRPRIRPSSANLAARPSASAR